MTDRLRVPSLLLTVLILLALVAPAHAARIAPPDNRRPALPPALHQTLFSAPALPDREPAPSASPPGTSAILDAYSRLPLRFEPNQGQHKDPVRFAARRAGQTLFFTADEVAMVFSRQAPSTTHAPTIPPLQARRTEAGSAQHLALKLRFPGASPTPHIEALDPLPGQANYFATSDPARWQQGVPAFGSLVYRDLYPGTDLRFEGTGGQLTSRFVVHPGAVVDQIALAYAGAEQMQILPSSPRQTAVLALAPPEGLDGGLQLGTAWGPLTAAAPRAWQETGPGQQQPVDVAYRLRSDGNLGFTLGAHDPTQPIFVDVAQPEPADAGLTYSTFLGGDTWDEAYGIAVDGAGNAFVTGATSNPHFPTTEGAYNQHHGPDTDVFVFKLAADGGSLLYSTLVGGSGGEMGWTLALDSAGNAVVIGQTQSWDFPTTPGAFDREQSGGADAFVLKLAADGGSLLYSTFAGGSDEEWCEGLALTGAGNAIVAGTTLSADFPTTSGAYDRQHNGQGDIFVLNLSADGSTLVYSTFLGAGAWDWGSALVLDGAGRPVITGGTVSSDFPTTSGAYDTSPNGEADAIVVKLSADGSSLVYSTVMGGSATDYGVDLAFDGQAVVVAGGTRSPDLPATSGAYDSSHNGDLDVLLFKLAANGDQLLYSTYVGGEGEDQARAVEVDGAGNAVVAGPTSSWNFPTTSRAYDKDHNGEGDAFVLKLSPGGDTLQYSTFFGGAYHEHGAALDLTGDGSAVIAGHTESWNLPTNEGAYDRDYDGDRDVFVARLAADLGALDYGTYVGAGRGGAGLAVAAAQDGSAVVSGVTVSPIFPTTEGAYDQGHHGYGDVFVSRLSADGSSLLYSTFVGGSGEDQGRGLVLDSAGNAVVTGDTDSWDFPTTSGSYDINHNGASDAFAFKLAADGGSLLWSTLLGGNGDDWGRDVVLDGAGNAVIVGCTNSDDLPTTPGAFDRTFNGADDEPGDVFVAKLAAGGASLLYSTYVGGSNDDLAYNLVLDGAGNPIVVGRSDSADFPTTAGAYDPTHNGGNDGFVFKLAAGGGSLLYSTFVGGTGGVEGARGLVLDSQGNALVTGWSDAPDFPALLGAYDRTNNGGIDTIFFKLSAGGDSLLQSTFLGGEGTDWGIAVELDCAGNPVITGATYSVDFPTTANAYDTDHNGDQDVFVARLSADGRSLLYSTYVGGGGSEYPLSLALDGEGQALATGATWSWNFPTTSGAFDPDYNLVDDAFVFRMALPLPAPTLLPTDNTDGDGDYTIDWTDIDGAQSYILQVDADAAFPNPATIYTGPSSQFGVSGQAQGTWYYRVRASSAAGDSAWSTWLYADDFGDPDSGWSTLATGDRILDYVDGEYQIRIETPDLGTLSTPDLVLPADYQVEVDARQESTEAGHIALAFGTLFDDPLSTYYFWIDPSVQEYRLSKIGPGGSDTALIDWTYSPAIHQGTQSNHLRVVRRDPDIHLYANGTHLATAQDGSYGAGRDAGLRVYAHDGTPADVRFDNFQASRVHAVVVSASPPDTPSLLPIDNTDGDGNYLVDWTAVTGAVDYWLEEDDNAAFSSPTAVYAGPNTQYSITGRGPGTWYYRVRASNNAGNSAWSTAQSVVVGGAIEGDAYEIDDTCAAAKPISSDGTIQTHNFHDEGDEDWVRFEAQAGNTYAVQVANVGDKVDAVIMLYNACDQAPLSSEHNAFGPTVRMEWDAPATGVYYLRLIQNDASQHGAGTDYDLSVAADTTAPSAPRSLRAASGDGKLVVQWRRSPERDVAGYLIWWGEASGPPYSAIDEVDGAGSTYLEITNLVNDRLYYISLQAVDLSGNESDYSREIAARPSPSGDLTPPVVSVDRPTVGTVYTTTRAILSFGGTTTDAGENLSRVQVRNAATGSEGWDYSLSGGSADFAVEGIALTEGTNHVQVTAYDTNGNSGSASLTVRRISQLSGAAVIVGGRNNSSSLQTNINYVTSRAYRVFQSAGLAKESIYYLSPTPQDADGDGASDVRATTSPAEIHAALQWAAGRLGPGVPFYLFLMDHGGIESFCADGCSFSGRLTSEQLDGWLDELESSSGCDRINIIIDACHSGSFLDRFEGLTATISKNGRVVIASTGRNNNAYASAQGAYFSDAFFSAIAESSSLKDSFERALDAVQTAGFDQTPWLDDNGDGLYNAVDGAHAADRYVARQFGTILPEITTAGVALDGTEGEISATVARGDEPLRIVWAAIYAPSFQEPAGTTLDLGVPLVELAPDPEQPDHYTAGYNGFVEEGTYRIVLYADDQTGNQAQPRTVFTGGLRAYLPLVWR